MEKIQVKIKSDNCLLPSYATAGSAAVDLRAALKEDLLLAAGERALIPTGIRLAIPDNAVGLVFARSGLAVKHGLQLANGVGVIDSDYRGEIKVGLYNCSKVDAVVHPGDRIAQLAFMPVFAAQFLPVEELEETARGTGGFGSTGK